MILPAAFFLIGHLILQTSELVEGGGSRRRHPLEGQWRGDGFTLTIDEDAIQANRNLSKPFEWEALHVLNVTGGMVVFELGGDRFIGILSGERMTLNQIGRAGFWVLTRHP